MLWSLEGHRQCLPAAVVFCNVNTSSGDPQIELHCIHFQLTFHAFKQRKWETEKTELLPWQHFFLSKYRTDKHSFADLDDTKCKSASFSKFLTPLYFLQYWCTAGYTHALLHVCVFAFMFSMFFMFPLCLCEFFPGTFLKQSILELETPWRV